MNKFLSLGEGKDRASNITFNLGDKVPSEIDFIAVMGNINKAIVLSLYKTPRNIGKKYFFKLINLLVFKTNILFIINLLKMYCYIIFNHRENPYLNRLRSV